MAMLKNHEDETYARMEFITYFALYLALLGIAGLMVIFYFWLVS